MTRFVTISSRDDLVQALRDRRHLLNVGQRAVAKAVGTQQSAVSDWESGDVDPTLCSVLRWADALGIRVQLVIPSAFSGDGSGS